MNEVGSQTTNLLTIPSSVPLSFSKAGSQNHLEWVDLAGWESIRKMLELTVPSREQDLESKPKLARWKNVRHSTSHSCLQPTFQGLTNKPSLLHINSYGAKCELKEKGS